MFKQDSLASLIVLVRMQLKEKLDLSFLKSRRSTAFHFTYFVIGFVLAMLGARFAFNFLVSQKIVTITNHLPLSVLIFVFAIMQTLAIISSTAGLVKALYFSGDNQILLTLPVSGNSVFFSKLIVFYFYELKKNATFTLPVFIAYGWQNGFSPLFYLVATFTFVFISLVPVVLGALFSIPLALLGTIVRKKVVLFLAAAVLAATIIAGFFYAVSLIPANIDIVGSFGKYFGAIQGFLNSFERNALPFTYLVKLACGKSSVGAGNSLSIDQLWILLATLGFCSLILFIVYLLARPLFFKMASKPDEHNARGRAIKNNNPRLNVFLSSLKKEIILSVRNPAALIANTLSIVLLPFAIFLLNKLFAALSTRLLGDLAALSFNIFLTLLILLCGNVGCASIFSAEGKSVYVLKIAPESLGVSLAAKIMLSSVLTLISASITTAFIISFNNLTQMQSVLCPLIILTLGFGHIFWSAQLDIVYPQHKNSSVNNPNEVKSMAIAFTVSFLTGAAFMILAGENLNLAWIKLAVFSVGFLIVRLVLLIMNAKVFFKHI